MIRTRVAGVALMLLAGCDRNESTNAQDNAAVTAPAMNATGQATAAAPVPAKKLRPLGTEGSEWRIITTGGVRPSRKVDLIDYRTVVELPNGVKRVWRAEVKEDAGLDYDLVLEEFDCRNRTGSVQKIASSKPDGLGLTVFDGDKKVEPVIPGTMGALRFRFVCEDATGKGFVVPAGQDPIYLIDRQFKEIRLGELFGVWGQMERDGKGLSETNKMLVVSVFRAAASNSGEKLRIDSPTDRSLLAAGLTRNIKDKAAADEVIKRLGL